MSTFETKSKALLHEYLLYGGFGACETEFRFHPTRKWRADYALLEQTPPVLIEYDGIMRHNAGQGIEFDPNTGRRLPTHTASHSSIRAILRDQEKINEAQAAGYRVYRTTAKAIQDGSFFTFLERVLQKISNAH